MDAQRPPAPDSLAARLKQPHYLIPIAIVGVMLAVAFGVQPGSSHPTAEDAFAASVSPPASTATPAATSTPLPSATAEVPVQPSPDAASPAAATSAPTGEVAGARSTPEATPSIDPELASQPTQCGALQESTTALAVEQSINGVSIKATRAAVYDVDYFTCILMATGGQEAVGLASAVSKAARQGMTDIVLVDLWAANSSRLFGQVNLRTASLAAAGQTFGAIATLGGRSEVVISSGQGRTVTAVFAIENNVGATSGPLTLVVDAPLAGGTPTAGKYQLFLPTP